MCVKAVLDTNIFISGIFWPGASYGILSLWKKGKITLVTSQDTLRELTEVLSDFKILLPKDKIQERIDDLARNSILVEALEKIRAVPDDPKDDIILEAAVAGRAEYIVAQDKHLLKMKEFRGIKIVMPSEFIALFPNLQKE